MPKQVQFTREIIIKEEVGIIRNEGIDALTAREVENVQPGLRVLETDRLILRPWRETDADALFKYASDPDVGPRAGWPPHKSAEESLEVIRTVFSGEGMWAVELKATGEVTGCVGYLPASGRVMEKCGFVDTGQRRTCPGLLVGSEKEVRVLKSSLNQFPE